MMTHLSKGAAITAALATLPLAARAHGLHEATHDEASHLAAHLGPLALLAAVGVAAYLLIRRREGGK